MFTNVGRGVGAAFRNYRLVLVIWALQLALGALAAWPAANWWHRAFDLSPEAGTLLRGFNFGVFADLVKYDQAGAFAILTSAALAVACVSWLSSPFVMGGILKVLSRQGSGRTTMHLFFGGGGAFYWRFFRLMIVGGICMGVVGGVVMAALAAIQAPIIAAGLESALYRWVGIDLLAISLVMGLFMLALDYARIRVMLDDSRGMFRAYFRALAFVLRNPLATFGMALLVIVPVKLLNVVYVAYESESQAAATWGAILTLILVQQAIAMARVGLRVTLVDAERRYVGDVGGMAAAPAAVPPAPLVPEAVPPVAQPDAVPPPDVVPGPEPLNPSAPYQL